MKKHLAVIGKAFSLLWDIDKVYPFLLSGRSLITAILPLYFSVCVSGLVSELAGEKRVNHVVFILFIMVVGRFLGKACHALLDWQCSYRYMRIQDVFTMKNSMKAMKMEYSSTENSEIVDLYANAWKANMSSGAILENVLTIIGQTVQVLGCIGIILHLGPVLLGVVAVFMVLYYFLDYRAGVCQRDYEHGIVGINRLTDYIRRCMGEVSCAKDIRLYYSQEFFLNRLSLLQKQRIDREYKKELFCGGAMSCQAILQMLQTIVMYVVLIRRYLKGYIQIGYFSLAVSSVTIFMNAVKDISAAWNRLIKNEIYLEYLERFQNLPERFQDNSAGKGKNDETAKEDTTDFLVEFKNVWFRYPGAEKYVLEDINVRLKTREITTIVGENGSGKTTFVKLLLGLYRPTSGEILLNGRNIDEYSDEEYRKTFAPVFQDYQLFAYSIRENLVFDRVYDKAKAEAVLDELDLNKKIKSLPEGIEQCVGKGYEKNGVDFSGGERQKLSIARALLKDHSSCLVLDEPTAALDPLAEVALYRKINELARERACIFITHRLAGIYFSDRILYFEKGRITEQGSCQELLERRAYFYEFYQLQAKLYQ